MKRLVFFVSIAAALMLSHSCSVKEIQDSSDGLKTITKIEATIEDAPLTKVHLEGTNKINWSKGDVIGIYSDTDDPVPFTRNSKGVFECPAGQSVSGHEFYAFYPYDRGQIDAANHKVLHFDSRYPATGKDPHLDIPMVAKSDGSALSFKHASGILHFSITGTKLLKSVYFYSNGEEIIASDVDYDTKELIKGTIDFAEDTPVLRYGDRGTDILAKSTPVQLSLDNPFDIWFVIPPITLSEGFTLVINYEGGSISKSTHSAVTIGRATIKNYSLVDLNQLIEEEEVAIEEERQALIALYNALDGPHWKDNTNWCSDKPVSQWYGVTTDANGLVQKLDLKWNGLNGAMPAEIVQLKHLNILSIEDNEGIVTNLDPIFDLTQLVELEFGIGEREWKKSQLFAVSPKIGSLKKLNRLMISGTNTDLPEELFGLEQLEYLELVWFNTGKPLQSGMGKLKNLKELYITGNGEDPVCGELPDWIYDLQKLEFLIVNNTAIGGQLSPRIGELKNLNTLHLPGNQFSGPLPAELANLSLLSRSNSPLCIYLSHNHFSGKVPEAFRNWPEWQQCWGYIIDGNNLDYSEVMPMIPSFEATTLDGRTIGSEMAKNHELTLLFQSASWCPFSPEIISELNYLYPAYKDKGLEVFCFTTFDEDEETVRAFANKYGFTWPTFINYWDYQSNRAILGLDMYPVNSFPAVTIFNTSGQLVYYQLGGEGQLASFIENYMGAASDIYESTDYSADGSVHTLQTATRGTGIDIVLMGDSFSDRLIADGTYASTMQRAMEAFFSEEPYKSFRDCFNVYYVDIVSKNERYTAETALGSWYGTGTAVGGDDAKVIEYTRKAISDSRMDDATVLVMMNRDYYAGTCYMYPPENGGYLSGFSISYFPVSSFDETFTGILLHEAGGHGFGKLADEYYYASYGAIPQEKIEEYRSGETNGWWQNGDFTSDPASVKWSRFLSDERYVNEGLGVYEGAFQYYYGAWRPTRNSIMNNNTEGFNAPSRYSIWRRLCKLAYGDGWNGTYEDFVEWDMAHRPAPAAATPKSRRQNYVEKDFKPLAPPVVMKHSWRDLAGGQQ